MKSFMYDAYVFVDAKPDETLEPSKERQHFFVAIMCSQEAGVERVPTDFKNTKRRVKARRAEHIARAIEAGELNLIASVVTGISNGQLVQLAVDAINEVRDQIGAEWLHEGTTPHTLRWKGHDYSIKSALGSIVYSGMLPILCTPFAVFADRQSDINGLRIILDQLPGNSEHGMQLMNAVACADPASAMWADMREKGLNIYVGNLGSFTPTGGKPIPGKRHPHAILVDWVAVGAYAFHSPKVLQAENDYTDREIEAFASIWRAIESKLPSKIVDLDDLPQEFFEYQKRFLAEGSSSE